MSATIPARKPARPFFSSGPCAKPPGYSPEKLATESLGRSHRAKIGKTRLQYCIDLMREVLQLPDTHRIGIVPGSDTGAFEMAMWTMLGAAHPMEAHRADSRAMFSRGQSADAREGVESFLEKRPAQFADRVSDGLPDIFPGREAPVFE